MTSELAACPAAAAGRLAWADPVLGLMSLAAGLELRTVGVTAPAW